MSAVRYQGVEKTFGPIAALHALDLDLPDRTFLALLGPSGCGKTTALRILAGLELPTAGRVLIGERDVTRLQPRDRDVAMVFQSYALYPHMSVRKNIEFPLKTRRVAKEEREELVLDAAQSLGLETLFERKPAQLSGGQRQRVALARAIVRRPEVFLMDEPLSNLDAKLRVQTRAELVELQRSLATTVVYVTHDQVEAMTMGHRIAIMSDGVLHQVGPPQSVYEKPANLFVARFIGTPPMNTLTARVVREDGQLAVSVPGARIPVPEPLVKAITDANLEAVVLGVRPEHLEFEAGGALPAMVTVIESLGHERHVICRLDDSQMVIVRQASDQPAPGEGSMVRLATEPQHLHVFDAATEQRVEPG